MGLTRVKPSGFWTGSDYVGTMPDGRRQKFPTEREYAEEFETVLDEEMAKLKEFADAILPLGNMYLRKEN